MLFRRKPPTKGPVASISTLAAAAWILLLTPLAAAQSPYDVKGRWTHHDDEGALWNHRPIHMVLLPGDPDWETDPQKFHSYILSWHKDNPDASVVECGGDWCGGVWGWNPPSSQDALGTYPNDTIVWLDPQPSGPGVEIFCSGAAALSDGRAFVAGGTDFNTTGNKVARIYDPWLRSWTAEEEMEFSRYYATNTALPGGKMLVTHGWQGYHMLTFGGLTAAGQASSAQDELERLVMTNHSEWDPPAPQEPGEDWPEARADHTAVVTRESDPHLKKMIVFGGKRVDGQIRDDTWMLRRSQLLDNEEVYTWERIADDGSAPFRARHGAVFASDEEMYVFGGIDDEGFPQNDVYRMYEDQTGWHYEPVITDGVTPSARYGHAIGYDDNAGRSRMIVFGGRTSETTLADDDVYILDLEASPPQWTQHDVAGPSAREGHSILVDAADLDRAGASPEADWRRMILYGGDTTEQEAQNTPDDEVWTLWISPTDPNHVEWQQMSPDADPQEGPPPARTRHSAAWQWASAPGSEPDKLTVFGGETSSGVDAGVWVLDVAWPGNEISFDPKWTYHSAGSVSLTGHTAITDPIPLEALLPEIYDPTQPPTQRWTTLTQAPRRNDFYPMMFLLPSGNVFMAGRRNETQVLKLDQTTPTWDPVIMYSDFWTPSAVMYEPGKIMKCGIINNEVNTQRIDLSTSDFGQWEGTADFESRRDHNLTLLPDGRVIATGGAIITEPEPGVEVTTFKRGPQIWNPGTVTWTPYGELEEESIDRRHHSTAIMLPDARVMSRSEHLDKVASRKTTIYAPPYLFTSAGLAARPTVESAPSTVGYGQSFTICTPEADAIASAALLKPSASTHEFNQDQRYVPLAIAGDRGGLQITVTSPLNENHAPPGYYLLFLVDAQGVPSIGRWIQVTAPPSSDAHAPDCTVDLAPFDVRKYSILLSWTATGDDGLIGNATSFELRRSTDPIDATNFDDADIVPTPAPEEPGTPQCAEAYPLTPCTTYYFAIKTLDEVGNTSCISNIATATTECSGSSSVCFGGGLFASGGEGGGWYPENSILGGESVDLYPLNGPMAPDGGQLAVRVTQTGSSDSELDHVRLGYLDHEPNLVAVAGRDLVYVGSMEEVEAVTVDTSKDVTSSLSGPSPGGYVAQPGRELVVSLKDALPSKVLVLDLAGGRAEKTAGATGVFVQSQGSDGTWETIETIQPRRGFSRYAVEGKGASDLRLVFLDGAILKSVSQLTVHRTETPAWLSLASAEHSRLGDVTQAVQASEGATTTMISGDALELRYVAPKEAADMIRTFYLRSTGSGGSYASSSFGPPALPVIEAETFEFALGPARPNPTTGSVRIGYSLARGTHVTIQVYDVAGRLVRTLARGPQSAGPHVLLWDAREDTGGRVRAGVYFYRMTADSWQSQRRVVFLNP